MSMTPEEYASLALMRSGMIDHFTGYYERQFLKAVEDIVRLAITEEREECAKVCEEDVATDCAKAIRERK